jgi:glycosyltransferase involved in cell wall biosynthesis
MKVLTIHNSYQERGGEDTVFEAEQNLLRAHGHDVVASREDNSTVTNPSLAASIRLASGTVWSTSSYRKITETIRRFKPDVAHFHNTLPLVSPSAYYACHKLGVPVVQTLHNYRLLCPAATLFRDGAVCEECISHSLLRSVRYGCYRQSRPATAAVATMLAVHRSYGTWHRMVDRYITLTEFARKKFADAGLPAPKLIVKPNFIEDPGEGPIDDSKSAPPDRSTHPASYALFVGRLAPEKGIRTLLNAWTKLSNIPLLIAGDGPIREQIQKQNLPNVAHLNWVPRDEIVRLMKAARFLIFPSEWYEGFPMTIVEAFACSTPVIASRLGGMAEIVEDSRTGVHFTAGDSADLASKVEWAWAHPNQMSDLGRNARAEYEAKYTAERNYKMLIDIYQQAIQEVLKRSTSPISEALCAAD